MPNREFTIYSPDNKRVSMKVIPGHFVTSHSHINYYVDMTNLLTSQREAEAAAKLLAQKYANNTAIDTIVCLNNSEVIGAYLAQELVDPGVRSMNSNTNIYIMAPEQDINGQMVLRDNSKPMVKGKNVLILSTSITTGVSLSKAISSIEYYGGEVRGIAAIFSFVSGTRGMQVCSIFDAKDLSGYESHEFHNCPMCKAKQKIDAIVNGFGYSKL